MADIGQCPSVHLEFLTFERSVAALGLLDLFRSPILPRLERFVAFIRRGDSTARSEPLDLSEFLIELSESTFNEVEVRFPFDLADLTTHEIYEIKSVNQQILAAPTVALYLFILNLNDPVNLWTPGYTFLPRPVYPVNPTTVAVVTPPSGGVILYKLIDATDLLKVVLLYSSVRLGQALADAFSRAALSRGYA